MDWIPQINVQDGPGTHTARHAIVIRTALCRGLCFSKDFPMTAFTFMHYHKLLCGFSVICSSSS